MMALVFGMFAFLIQPEIHIFEQMERILIHPLDLQQVQLLLELSKILFGLEDFRFRFQPMPLLSATKSIYG